ncbi:MAG: flavodoxin-dependent (E)-4-hydroxy-3-methylbut-2-enyl-diphosphate synthase, partial [Lachnospiraceae bacterium]|nr:flavodoxin-dependent (E)-4-hydroxy-3-methylbut-2-enyl-diphosphate synthase [Lachnospiraceae bacterium]
EINLVELARQVEQRLATETAPIKVAVMGCVVNGPGEAKEADIGIAGGIKEGLLIKKGEIIKKVPESELLNTLKYELDNWGA